MIDFLIQSYDIVYLVSNVVSQSKNRGASQQRKVASGRVVVFVHPGKYSRYGKHKLNFLCKHKVYTPFLRLRYATNVFE
jgi:hypothetical protein